MHGVKEEKNILLTMKRRKYNSVGHILPSKTRYKRKDARNDRSARRTRKKTQAAAG
jgi:hypothetical protein